MIWLLLALLKKGKRFGPCATQGLIATRALLLNPQVARSLHLVVYKEGSSTIGVSPEISLCKVVVLVVVVVVRIESLKPNN